MEAEYCNEPPRSTEEEDELGYSVKKFKESSGVKQDTPLQNTISYKDSLIGDIPGAYQQAFKLDNVWDDDEESDTKVVPLIEGMVKVMLSKETKTYIRAPWSKALIVKVFGRTFGFSFLTFKLNALWKPATRMDCVNLGNDYFLIKFYCSDDYDKVLHGGPWFIGEHFLAIKPWEPYFRASGDNLSSVDVWVRFPKLPIEFYDIEVLKEIGSAISPVLRIDSYTATRSRGSYARLCIQIDLDKPLIKSIRIGRLVQQVKYEGIPSLCFCCGRLGHKQEKCCYKIKENIRSGVVAGKSPNQLREEDKQEDSRSEESPTRLVSKMRLILTLVHGCWLQGKEIWLGMDGPDLL